MLKYDMWKKLEPNVSCLKWQNSHFFNHIFIIDVLPSLFTFLDIAVSSF